MNNTLRNSKNFELYFPFAATQTVKLSPMRPKNLNTSLPITPNQNFTSIQTSSSLNSSALKEEIPTQFRINTSLPHQKVPHELLFKTQTIARQRFEEDLLKKQEREDMVDKAVLTMREREIHEIEKKNLQTKKLLNENRLKIQQ